MVSNRSWTVSNDLQWFQIDLRWSLMDSYGS